MSVDVASLVFEFDSTQAKQVVTDLDRVTAAGDRVDASVRRVRTATQIAGVGMQAASAATVQATRSATDLANAQGAVEKATRASTAASAETRATRALEATAMRELVLASKDYEASLASQARQEAVAAASKARLAAQVGNIMGRIDPLVRIQNVAAASTAKLDQALAAGVITAEKHAAATAGVTLAAEEGVKGLTALGAGAKLSTVQMAEFVHVARSAADALAAGANPFRVLAMEGGRLAQAFGSGPGGVGGTMAALLSPMVLVIAALIAAAAAVAVVTFAAFKGAKEIDDFNGSLIATGNFAGLSTSSLYAMSAAVAQSSDTTVSSSRKTIEALAGTGKFGRDTILSLADAAEQYARITGKNTDQFIKEYEGMKDSLVKFAVTHEDTYHDLTLAQVQHIALLVKEGRETAAQEYLAQQIDQSAKERAKAKMEQEETSYGLLQQWAHNLHENWTNAWDAILGIGRPTSNIEKVGAAVDKLARDSMQLQIARRTPLGNTPQARALQDAGIARDQTALEAAQKAANADSDKAAAQAAEAKKNHDAIQGAFGDGKPHGKGPADNNATALDTAKKAELAAQLALTGDVQEIAAIKHAEVAAELKLQTDRLAKEVHDKTITGKTAELATTAYQTAATAKNQLIDREAQFALQNRALAQEQTLARFTDQTRQAQQELAATAEERGQLELKGLAAQQDFDRRQLATQNAQAVIQGTMTGRMAAELESEQLAAQAAQRKVTERNIEVEKIHEAAARQQSTLELQASGLGAEASLLKSSFARAVKEREILDITQKIALSKAQEAVDVAKVGSVERQQAEEALAALKLTQTADKKLAADRTDLIHAVTEATSAVSDMQDAFQRHDWASLLTDLQRTIQSVQAAFKDQGTVAGLTTIAAVAGHAVGGKIGNAVGDAASAGLTAFALTGNPIIAAAAAAAAGLLDLLKGKPSNNGAIATFSGSGFALSGDKRNDTTSQLASVAGNAILQGEALLKAAGITLTATVSKIDIGTRDATHILLSNGQELSSAVGDSAAAAETALKALLSGATYTSDAEKKLVDSMLAAGDGFDAITAGLANFQAAQAASAALADQILQLQDPKAYDQKGVTDAINAQRTAAQAAADAGYLTADQLSTINGQLDTLQGLQLDAVQKRYAAATDAATEALKTLQDSVDTARQTVQDDYDAQSSALQAVIDKSEAAAASLEKFSDSLRTGDLAGLDPSQQLAATRAQFNGLAALPAGDETRLAGLQTASEAFLAASKAASPTQAAYNRDLAAVRLATDASAKAALAQVSDARQQLDALNKLVEGQLDVKTAVVQGAGDIVAALANLALAQAALAAAQGGATSTPAPANDNSAGAFNATAYGAKNPDVVAAFPEYQANAATWATSGFGANDNLEQFLADHYRIAGQAEGRQAFATGGSGVVGGSGGADSKNVDLALTPGELVNVSRPGEQADLIAEMRSLRDEVARLRKPLDDTARSTGNLDSREAKREIRGIFVRGATPDDPVLVDAA